jgi:hypothetical protein
MGAEQSGSGLQPPRQAPSPPATGLQERVDDTGGVPASPGSFHGEPLRRIWRSDSSVPQKLWDSIKELNRTGPDALQHKLHAQVLAGVRPPNEGFAALDQVESNTGATLFYLGANAMGASNHQANLAADLGAAAGGLTMAGASRFGRMPLYTGAVRAQQPDAPGPVPHGPSPDGVPPVPGQLGPSLEDFIGLVDEHSKSNDVPLTSAGARAIFAQTQPPWTTAHVVGDNVPGADILYRDFSGTEWPGTGTQVKAAGNLKRAAEYARDELRNPKGAPVIAVQVPRGTDAARLMGKVRSNPKGHDRSGRSITVVDEDGKVLVGKQPAPDDRSKTR